MYTPTEPTTKTNRVELANSFLQPDKTEQTD
jgi:hypothetical protein